jgi:hypothetical protein
MVVCEVCAQQVDPEDPSLVHARVNSEAGGDGESSTADTEADVLFHAHCFPADSPVWRRRD